MDGTSEWNPADNHPRNVSPVKPDDGKNLSDIDVKVLPDQTNGALDKSEKQNVAAVGVDHNTTEENNER